ncbi:hypothetical protein [Sphingomonas sp. CFBP 13733]|uniref:hypothetical protein n=1 Tax=Sphingomonas sp. CFBP 13733 TaxID=2775291 RepID=UPI00177B8DAF|nr:hypothetical protein [Sphingomonas sp. CFBP 13733]MBD8639808.1 hypothetical protein [Sphingomonas sp. CFBP 13733]
MTAIDALSADIRYDGGAAAVLISDLGGAGAGDRLATALDALGGRLIARIDWHVPLDRSATPRIILVDTVGINAPLLAERMAQIVGWAADTDAALVVALRADQIDAITALTLGGATSLLVDPGIGECVAAVAIAIERSRQPAGVFDVTRESDGARLERLSAEVGRIAEALARLTQADHDRPSDPPAIVGDRSVAYQAAPGATQHDATDIRRAIRARRLRDQFFGGTLFEDPGWDMLLDLYAADLERRRVSVSSLCIAAAVAPTTALRWIARMTDSGLFERQPDPHDRRRAYMALSPPARDAMRGYFGAVLRNELRIA